jgi:hypothetical protein
MSNETPVEESLSLPHPIIGYRDLSQAEIDLINAIKAHAEVTRDLVERVEAHVREHAEKVVEVITDSYRWKRIARDHLQQGYMALTRAVARPTTF